MRGQREANVRLSQVSSSALIKEWIPAAYKEGAVVSQDLSLSTNAQTDVMKKKCRGTVVLQSGKNLLSGEMPSLVGDGKGCAFASRCKFCKEICKEQRPELKTVGHDHFAACHFAGELTF